MKYYKIINPEGHYGMIYKEGLNTDILPFNPSGDCEPGGIYFSREDILGFISYGTELYEVEPVGEVYENPYTPRKWKAHEVNLTYVGKAVDNIPMLISEGANIHAENDYILRWTSEKGHLEVVKVLLENGIDIHTGSDYALRWTSRYGHYKIVKLLLKNGANVHADNDYALRRASENGHYKVVKLLLENGANVHAGYDYALQWASLNGHTKIVELLKTYIKNEIL